MQINGMDITIPPARPAHVPGTINPVTAIRIFRVFFNTSLTEAKDFVDANMHIYGEDARELPLSNAVIYGGINPSDFAQCIRDLYNSPDCPYKRYA